MSRLGFIPEKEEQGNFLQELWATEDAVLPGPARAVSTGVCPLHRADLEIGWV